MANFLLRSAAERHRVVASTLTNPNDQAIINRYADEVENLARREVTPSSLHRDDSSEPERWLLADVLSKLYRPEPTLQFDELLDRLDRLETQGTTTSAPFETV